MNIYELAGIAVLKRYQEQAPGIDGVVGNWADLERFADLIAAHEREACAKVADGYIGADPIATAIRARGTT